MQSIHSIWLRAITPQTHHKYLIVFNDIVMEHRSDDSWEEVVQEEDEKSEEERGYTRYEGQPPRPAKLWTHENSAVFICTSRWTAWSVPR